MCGSDTNTSPVAQPCKEFGIRQLSTTRAELTYRKIIDKRASGANLTLCDTGRPIHVGSSLLIQAMEMQAGGLVAEGVLYVDNNTISFCCRNRRDRPFAVYSNDGTGCMSIRVGMDPGYIEIIADYRSM